MLIWTIVLVTFRIRQGQHLVLLLQVFNRQYVFRVAAADPRVGEVGDRPSP